MTDKQTIKRILVLDFCNFIDYQIGGFLSFARNLMIAFGNQLVLVGITTDHKDPVGRWYVKNINGIDYDCFALARYNKSKSKNLLPDRLISFLAIKYYKRKIISCNIQNVLIQRQEILIAVKNFGFKNICYRFPGMENPLKISKYWFGIYLARTFDKFFFSSFNNVKIILAAGDDQAIDKMVLRSEGVINKCFIMKFPTRINTKVFQPLDRNKIREELGIRITSTVVTTIGRLTWLKGWKFMLDCFNNFRNDKSESFFYFVGEGEDYPKIKNYASSLGIINNIIFTGKQEQEMIAKYLNASDLFIMGSYEEGWSTTLLEAIACGIPACVTNFSSANDIIIYGINGYVVNDHNINDFVSHMKSAIELLHPVFNESVKEFSVERMKNNLLKIWELI
jgi:glycosyltransferase involved in cell wall biosynthesis